MRRAFVLTAVVALLTAAGVFQPVLAGEPDVEVFVEVVVKMEAGASLDAALGQAGGVAVRPLIASRDVYLVGDLALVAADKIDKEADDAAEHLAKDLEKEDGVMWAEPVWREDAEDTRFHAWPEAEPVGVSESSLAGQEAFADLRLEEVHAVATGAGVIVAVLDTGVDAGHPLLASRLLPGYDLVADDADPSDEVDGFDDDADGVVDEAFGHGTFVAGVVAQIAPDAQILPLRVLDADGRAQLHTVVEGIDMAIEAGARVINISFSLPSDDKPDPLKDALKRAKDAGVLVVGASGNSGQDKKLYPASEGSVISVGALGNDSEDELVEFSSYGKWVLVAAPGVGIASAVPGGGYARWAGTSMATPVVAGHAALLFELDPAADRNDVEKALKDSARKMNGKHKAEKGVIDIMASFDKL